MVSEFLLPETTLREPGVGPEVSLGEGRNRRLSVILYVTHTAEQQSLDVCIWGSPDGTQWGPRPLVKLPRQFYCGTCRMVLDLSDRTDVRRLRADWQVTSWGRGDLKPLFTVELMVQEMQSIADSACAS
jgi:hypothetical protein